MLLQRRVVYRACLLGSSLLESGGGDVVVLEGRVLSRTRGVIPGCWEEGGREGRGGRIRMGGPDLVVRSGFLYHG